MTSKSSGSRSTRFIIIFGELSVKCLLCLHHGVDGQGPHIQLKGLVFLDINGYLSTVPTILISMIDCFQSQIFRGLFTVHVKVSGSTLYCNSSQFWSAKLYHIETV